MNANELQAAVNDIDKKIGELYREREPLLQQLAELRGAYPLPKPRHRTDTQVKVSRCPRCSAKLEEPADMARRKG